MMLAQPQTQSLSEDKTTLYEGKVSVSGKVWCLKSGDERLGLALSQKADVPEIVGRILASRGIGLDTVSSFLQPTLRDLMPDPLDLKDMPQAIDRTAQALTSKEKVAIFSDYDVDGATSSALLKRYFTDIGHDVTVYIPDRIEEGYGPNVEAMRFLHKQGITLIIMTDCGTTSFEPLAEAKSLGIDVIILDHHTSQATLPECYALVNPNRLDENSPLTHLCAAGLTFLFLAALQRKLRQDGLFSDISEPDLRTYLDLVALGTVCDVMPLTGLNRAYVAQGLKVLKWRSNIGLSALADISGLADTPSAYHLGFLLGPRVNAGGRVGKADFGSRLLSTRDPTEARLLAQQLDTHNRERQAIEAIVLDQAIEQIEQKELHKHPLILVGDEGWHPGVIGIVASRLKDRYSRPACVVGFKGGIGKGSGRSITGVHLGSVMHVACHQGLLIHGGGHAMAAGFSLLQENFEAFYSFLIEKLGALVLATTPTLTIDGFLSLGGATPELIDQLALLEPYGNGHPTPRFAFQHVRIGYAEKMGVGHLRCTLVGEDGSKIKGVAFRVAETALGEALLTARNQRLHVAGTVRLDTWGGRRDVTCTIDDVMM